MPESNNLKQTGKDCSKASETSNNMKLNWDTNAFYPVEQLLKWRYKVNRKGNLVREFLVKWKFHTHHFNSWEEYHHLDANTKAEADMLVLEEGKELKVVEKVNMYRWTNHAEAPVHPRIPKQQKKAKSHRKRGGRRPRKEYYVEWRGHSQEQGQWLSKAYLKRMKGKVWYKVKLLNQQCPDIVKIEPTEVTEM